MASSIIHYAITCELIKRRQFNNPDRLKLGSVLVDSGYNGNSHMKISVAEGQKKTYDLGGYREIYGGFNEKLTFGEDVDYIERIGKGRNFKVLRTVKVGVSTRRLDEEGLETVIKQYGKSTIRDFLGKKTEASDLDYNFGHPKENPKKTIFYC